jgi:hypothetical protein
MRLTSLHGDCLKSDTISQNHGLDKENPFGCGSSHFGVSVLSTERAIA